MVDISISKSYLAMVFCLVFCYETISLIFGQQYWGSQVFLIFLIMYLLHEPAHAFMAMWYGIEVEVIHLDRKDTYTLLSGIDPTNPKKKEIEGMIFGAGFAVDLMGILMIIGTCTGWGRQPLTIYSIVPIIFASVMAILFVYGLFRDESDFQELKKRLPIEKKAGA